MEDSRTLNGAKCGRVAIVRALCAAIALGVSFPASPQKPQPEGASGRIVQYEEKPVGTILYFEERGGTISPLAEPVSGSRREELPAFGSVAKPRAPTEPAAKKRSAAARAATTNSPR